MRMWDMYEEKGRSFGGGLSVHRGVCLLCSLIQW